jgi:hypothetical protein
MAPRPLVLANVRHSRHIVTLFQSTPSMDDTKKLIQGLVDLFIQPPPPSTLRISLLARSSQLPYGSLSPLPPEILLEILDYLYSHDRYAMFVVVRSCSNQTIRTSDSLILFSASVSKLPHTLHPTGLSIRVHKDMERGHGHSCHLSETSRDCGARQRADFLSISA